MDFLKQTFLKNWLLNMKDKIQSFYRPFDYHHPYQSLKQTTDNWKNNNFVMLGTSTWKRDTSKNDISA